MQPIRLTQSSSLGVSVISHTLSEIPRESSCGGDCLRTCSGCRCRRVDGRPSRARPGGCRSGTTCMIPGLARRWLSCTSRRSRRGCTRRLSIRWAPSPDFAEKAPPFPPEFGRGSARAAAPPQPGAAACAASSLFFSWAQLQLAAPRGDSVRR